MIHGSSSPHDVGPEVNHQGDPQFKFALVSNQLDHGILWVAAGLGIINATTESKRLGHALDCARGIF